VDIAECHDVSAIWMKPTDELMPSRLPFCDDGSVSTASGAAAISVALVCKGWRLIFSSSKWRPFAWSRTMSRTRR
jgi:hypothetical protein